MTNRAPVPPLEARPPNCSIYGETVDYQDDEWVCETCDAYWPLTLDNSPGEWLDDEAEQCEKTVRPYVDNPFVPEGSPDKQMEFRCVLGVGHGDHGTLHRVPNGYFIA